MRGAAYPNNPVGTGTAVAGSGGIPAADLPQLGNAAVGLRFGLAHAGAGPDWRMETNARTLGASANIILSANQRANDSPRIVLSIGAPIAAGEAGNNWGVTIHRNASQTARVENGGRHIEVLITGRTYAQVAAILNAVDGLTAVVTGNGGAAFPQPPAQGFHDYGDFSGGVDENHISADLDEDTKVVTFHYHSTDAQQNILDGAPYNLGEGSLLHIKPIAGTTLATAPVAPGGADIPFTRYFSEGSLPEPAPQQIGGNWAAAGTRLDLQLRPGNALQLPTPAAFLRFTEALLTKLQGIEDGATADQTGGEIIALINGVLGRAWQSGGGGGTPILFGGNPPDSALGANGNVFVETNGDIYRKEAGAWVQKAQLGSLAIDLQQQTSTTRGDEFVAASVATTDELRAALTAHTRSGNSRALVVQFTADVDIRFQFQDRSYSANTVVYFSPGAFAGVTIVTLPSGTPTPTPTTVTVTFGYADTADGAIANAQTADLSLGVRGELDFPVTIEDKYVVMTIPANHRFTSVRSTSFPDIEAIGDFVSSNNGLRLSQGPLRASGNTYDLLVTVEATD